VLPWGFGCAKELNKEELEAMGLGSWLVRGFDGEGVLPHGGSAVEKRMGRRLWKGVHPWGVGGCGWGGRWDLF